MRYGDDDDALWRVALVDPSRVRGPFDEDERPEVDDEPAWRSGASLIPAWVPTPEVGGSDIYTSKVNPTQMAATPVFVK